MARQRVLNTKEQDRIKQIDTLKQKHKGKTPVNITNADVMEWARQKMIQELDIEGAD